MKCAALQAEKNELTKDISVLEAEIAAFDTEIALKTLQREGIVKELKEALQEFKEIDEGMK